MKTGTVLLPLSSLLLRAGLILWISVSSATGAGPFALLHSLFNPSTNAQADAQQGYSVAVDGNIAVIGSPGSGAVKVYDAATGGLLHILTNSNPAGYDYGPFGPFVAISGTRIVVGTPDDDIGATDAGSVRVFDLASATPTLPTVTLRNPTPAPYDHFGRSVAISGMWLVVGATHDPTGEREFSERRVYVFDLASAARCAPVITLTNHAFLDDFGQSVAISGTRVVVGGPNFYSSGHAYVYDLASAVPTEPLLTITNPTPESPVFSYDYFGSSVAISATRVVVGSSQDQSGGGAYVYDLATAAPGLPVLTLTNPIPQLAGRFGASLAISSNRVVVGAYWDDTGEANAGSAYVYDLANAMPTVPTIILTNPTPAEDDYFGYSVAISGTRVVAGACQDDTGATDAGSAYVFDLSSATPAVSVATLNHPSPAPADHFGESVSISNQRMVVGAPWANGDYDSEGVAYVYDLASVTPGVPLLTLTNPSPAASDYFASAIAISDMRVVVGALWHNTVTNATGIAYVYDLNGSAPTVPAVTLTKPSPAAYDHFGDSVAISGARVVVGAPGAGAAYVFDLASPTPSLPVFILNSPIPANGGCFGCTVAISGTWVVVAAASQSIGASNAGAAYVYDLTSATPSVPSFTLTNPSPAVLDNFGYSVAISGTRVVVGTPFDDSAVINLGITYVYDLTSATPATPLLTVTNPVPGSFWFGRSVTVSGARVVIGASKSIYTGTGYTYSGVAFVYDLTSHEPTVPIVTLSNPTPITDDQFARSIAIDGTTIVAGDYIRGAAHIFGVVPRLRIVPTAPGSATISWTPASSGFVLQYADSFAPAHWLDAPSGALNPATISTTDGLRFYRLFQR